LHDLPKDRSMPLSPRTVSRGILAVLALQIVAVSRVLCTPKDLPGLPSIHLACPPAIFPFLDYPMFRARFRYGERIEYRTVIGVDEHGVEHRIAPAEGSEARAAEDHAATALAGDPAPFCRWLAQGRAPAGTKWKEARIESVELTLAPEGFEERRRDVLARIETSDATP
jgi:hypothetical protein